MYIILMVKLCCVVCWSEETTTNLLSTRQHKRLLFVLDFGISVSFSLNSMTRFLHQNTEFVAIGKTFFVANRCTQR